MLKILYAGCVGLSS